MLPVSRTRGHIRLFPPCRIRPPVSSLRAPSEQHVPRRAAQFSHSQFSRRFSLSVADLFDFRHDVNGESRAFSTDTNVTIQHLNLLVDEEKFHEADQMLSELLEEGITIPANPMYERAVLNSLRKVPGKQQLKAFTDWLSLLPDAGDASPGVFQEMVALLSVSPHEKLPFLMSLGTVGASKGYMALVESLVVPLVARISDPGTLASFTSNIYMAARSYRARMADGTTITAQTENPVVFEDLSEDYVNVSAQPKPVRRTKMELVERSLPLLLPELSKDDTLIFEEESDADYITQSTPAAPSAIRSSTEVLLGLVHDERYGDAHQVLRELMDVDAHIPESMHYESAAFAELNTILHPRAEDDHKAALDRFYDWISFLPPQHITKMPNPITRVTNAVISMARSDVLIKLSIILAKKGYAADMTFEVVNFIMKREPPEISLSFIKKFEEADQYYYESRDTPYKLKKATIIRSRAVRTLATSGRLDAALALVPEPKHSFLLTKPAYDALINALTNSQEPKMRAHIPRLETLKGSVYSFVQVGLDTDEAVPEAEVLPVVRYLRRAPMKKLKPLDVHVVADCMRQCIDAKRTRSWTLLLNKALRRDAYHAGQLLFAEMQYYSKGRRYDLVIETFLDHFFNVGVPPENYLRSHQQQMAPYGRFHRLSGIPILHPGKIWPNSVHCSLVWHALIATSDKTSTINNLYNQLLHILRDQMANDKWKHIPNRERPRGWKHIVDEGCFTPFMLPLMIREGAPRGTQILSDIATLGLKPSIVQFTELALFYVYELDARRAFLILDRLEASAARKVSTKRETRASGKESSEFPVPDHSIYRGLLQGFIRTRDLDSSEEVVRRFNKAFKYVPGEDPLLDECYKDLSILRKEVKSGISKRQASLS